MTDSQNWITPPANSFSGVPVCTKLDDLAADIAIVGLHYVSPYPATMDRAESSEGKESAAEAIRRQSAVFSDHLDHYDFDLDRILLPGGPIRIVDCGDILKHATPAGQNGRQITWAVRTILNRGALPIAFGDDEGGFIQVVRAYDAFDNICVVHVDAHIDWRNERQGVKEGFSSVMRRTSEMPWVKGMAQIGLRGIGSAKQREVDDARDFGSVFIRARDVHKKGVEACLKNIPSFDNYIITIDSDALDTAIAPGVLYNSPGGLSFYETTDIFRYISNQGSIIGLNIFEARPELDVNDLTVTTAVHLIINFIGLMAGGTDPLDEQVD